jgi:hypothetical protein
MSKRGWVSILSRKVGLDSGANGLALSYDVEEKVPLRLSEAPLGNRKHR